MAAHAALRVGKTIIQNSVCCLQQNTIKAIRVLAAMREKNLPRGLPNTDS